MEGRHGLALPGGVPDTITGALEWSVQRFGPDHPILEDRSGVVTLGELADRVMRGADALAHLGVRAGDRVAVSLPNDRTILELFLATQWLGAIWVGINENLAAPETAHLVGDCRPALYVDVEGGDGRLSVTEWLEATQRPSGPVAPSPVDPHGAAAIAYTSGTTGRPKGVVHSQHNLMVPAASFAWSGRVTPGRRTGVVYALTILNMVMQGLLTALCAGATCCVLTRRDAAGLVEQLGEYRVEQISLVPTAAYDIVHRLDDPRRAAASLRYVLIGGSHVRADIAQDLSDTLGIEVEHGFGLTEAPGLVTKGALSVPLTAGQALPHVIVEVRDEAGRSLVDEPGEIVVRARETGPWAGVWTPALGYWGTTDPRRGRPHELWTADDGVMDASGTLTVLDRRSDIILRGGSNVYPAEIERVVTGHHDVEAAVVVARAHDRLGQVPVAIVEIRDGAQIDDVDLVSYSRERIAAYKVPDVVIVPEIRRNALGKADRTWAKALVNQHFDDQRGDR